MTEPVIEKTNDRTDIQAILRYLSALEKRSEMLELMSDDWQKRFLEFKKETSTWRRKRTRYLLLLIFIIGFCSLLLSIIETGRMSDFFLNFGSGILGTGVTFELIRIWQGGENNVQHIKQVARKMDAHSLWAKRLQKETLQLKQSLYDLFTSDVNTPQDEKTIRDKSTLLKRIDTHTKEWRSMGERTLRLLQDFVDFYDNLDVDAKDEYRIDKAKIELLAAMDKARELTDISSKRF